MPLPAVFSSMTILWVHLTNGASSASFIKKWIEIVKHDFIVAFGCLEPARIFGPHILDKMTLMGYNFFESGKCYKFRTDMRFGYFSKLIFGFR